MYYDTTWATPNRQSNEPRLAETHNKNNPPLTLTSLSLNRVARQRMAKESVMQGLQMECGNTEKDLFKFTY